MDSRLDVAYLLFPSKDRGVRASEVLMPLTTSDCALLLARMRLAERLIHQDPSLTRLSYRSPFVAHTFRVGPFRRPDERLDDLVLGCAAHPALAASFRPGAHDSELLLELDGGILYLDDLADGSYFSSRQAGLSDLMLCQIATLGPRDVPAAFRQLSGIDPWTALDLVEHGLVLHGCSTPVRSIHPLLAPGDLASILEWPEAELRERAITLIGRCGRRR